MTSVIFHLSGQTAPSDETLALEAGRDPAAFSELYQRHFNRVYRYHLAHTGSVHDAQDLTTQTFLAALEGLPRYRGDGSFAAWLLSIARNKMALHFRAHKEEAPLEAALNLTDPLPSLETAAEHRLQMAQISRALSALAPDRAEALRLCLFSDLTAAEAGRVMARSEAAVKMLIFRGLKDLREKIALSYQEEK